MKLIYPKNATAQFKEALIYAKKFAEGKKLKYVPASVLYIGLCNVDCLPKHILFSHSIVDFTIEIFMNYDEESYEYEYSLEEFVKDLTEEFKDMVITTVIAFNYLLLLDTKDENSNRSKEPVINKLFKEKGTSSKNLWDETAKNIRATSIFNILAYENEKVFVEKIKYSLLSLNMSDKIKKKRSRDEVMSIINESENIYFGEQVPAVERIDKKYANYNPRIHNFAVLQMIAEDITALALDGKLSKVIGREKELNRLITILSKKTKNNAVVLGEAGTGKTALVEKLAIEIVNGNVPENLKNKYIYSLSINSLVAGTRYRGDFESKIKRVLEEVEEAGDVILFIDEIHMIFKAGSSESNDVTLGNILKPYMARGRISIIGATTYSEYKATIEKDGALDRRFDAIKIDEMSDEESFEVLQKIKCEYEDYHDVKISDEVLKEIIKLSKVYIPEKHMPDKAIDLMDEVLATVKLSSKKKKVTKENVASVVSSLKGVDLNKILGKEDIFENLSKKLNKNVIGQEKAVERIVSDISLSYVPAFKKPAPTSVMLIGESGVGKTFISKNLAEILFGKDDRFIRLDMTEFTESNSVTKIIGAPPGYVGFDKIDGITEKVRINPQSVILFDEIDKACKDVQNLLLQILDEGTLTDASSRKIDFSQSIIILTANINSYKKKESTMGFEKSDKDYLEKDIITEMKKRGMSELIDRLDDVILLNSLKEDDIKKIIEACNIEIENSLKECGYNVSFDGTIVEYFYDNFFKNEKDSGARNVKSIVRKEIFKFVSSTILSKDKKMQEELLVAFDGNSITVKELELA